MFEQQLGQTRRQFLGLGLIRLRHRHDPDCHAEDQAQQHHQAQDAPETRLVVRREAPRQHCGRLGNESGSHYASFFRITANEISLKFARAHVTMTLRSSRYGICLSPMIVTALVWASFSRRITWRLA